MSRRLVIQHPALADAAVADFAAAVGRRPDRRDAGIAAWNDVSIERDRADALARAAAVDCAVLPAGLRLADFRLIAFDMDSTLITIECIDEIADFAGRKAEVAAITEAAMRGEITDFSESLRRRVALLAGLDASVLERVYDERLALSPGARQLVDGVRAAGLKILLVSGGFTYFTDRLARRLSLDHARANRLEILDDRLTGRVDEPIVDAQGKRAAVLETCATIGCRPSEAIVVGDGANDLAMMSVAGLSVAYRAKPAVRAQATCSLEHNGLDAVLALFD